VDTCYKKHGYPPSFSNNEKGNFTAYNSAYTDNTSENGHIVQSQQKDEVQSIAFTKQQYTGLLPLLKQQSLAKDKPSSTNGTNMIRASSYHVVSCSNCFSLHTTTSPNSVPWLLNTGATHHICCNLDWYIKLPMDNNLPNGHTVVAQISGTEQLTLDKVLQINLISVSKLTTRLNCTLTFTSKSCNIQETLAWFISSPS